MNKLYINTANSNLLIILKKDDKIFFKNEESVKKHNERILVLINELLKENLISLNDIDEFGVVIGPGSFTGIRVGIATVKAFRDALNKTAKGVNNLSLLYSLAQKENIDIVAIEASLNSYFVATKINDKIYIYNRNITEEELISLSNGKTVGCFELSEKMKQTNINFKVIKLDMELICSCFEESNDFSLVPVYYQLSQAENDKINRAELNIVKMVDGNIDEIESLEKELFSVQTTGEDAWNKETLNSIVNNENYESVVAKINKEIVGYIFCERTDEVNITKVAVKKEFQNHGIATKLIEFMFNKAKDEGLKLSLEVCENNITALNLYKKLGFKLRRIRKNYYKDKSNCLEMVKEA